MQSPRWLHAIPRSLLLLLTATAVLVIAWALISPAGQAPDESSHSGYAQVVVERFELPDREPGKTYSSEQELAEARLNVQQLQGRLVTRPEWSRRAYDAWRAADARLPADARSDGGHYNPESGLNTARSNPPLYYAWQALPYKAASGGDYFDRLYLMRLWSGLLLLVATGVTWLLIGEAIGRNPPLQLTGAALVGLQPMATFISASVNPDAALIALWAGALWLGVRTIRRGLSLTVALALAAVTALAVLTKGSGYALVPPVGLALIVGWWRSRPRTLRSASPLVAAALTFMVPVGAWLMVSRDLGRTPVNTVPSVAAAPAFDISFANYLWQFYLPKLPFQAGIPPFAKLPFYDQWIKTGWAAFGWLEVRLPEPIYLVLAVLTGVLMFGGLWAFLRRRGNGLIAVFFALAAVSLLAGLHWVEYRSILATGALFAQGRYLLPMLPVLGVLAAAALGALPRRLQAGASGTLLGGLFALQAVCLAVVTARFYA